MAMSDTAIVVRSMVSRWFSTAMTVLTVAVAVALLVILVSMRSSARSIFERGSGNMHLLVSADTSPLVSVLNSVFYAGAPARSLGWIDYQRLERDPRIAWAVPTLVGDSFRGFPVVGTTPGFFTRFRLDVLSSETTEGSGQVAWKLASGSVFAKHFEVVLGADVAKETSSAVGDSISLTHGMGGKAAHAHDEFMFDVVGILARTGTPHDRAVFIDVHASWILHAHDRREREGVIVHDHDDHTGHNHGPPTTIDDVTLDDQRITAIMVQGKTRTGRTTSAIAKQIAGELRANPTLTVAEPTTQIRKLFEIIGGVDLVLRAMAGVVLLSSGIGIMLALYNSMDQRRRQIAVLRVLGASKARVLRLVLAEAALIGVLGSVVGCIMALIGMAAVASVLKAWTGVVIVPNISLLTAVGIAGGAVVLATVSGLLPAIMAYRTSVATHLKSQG